MGKAVISEDKVIEAVKQAIAEALEIDKNTIGSDSSLIRDLGAESLDFLDINYRLEQAFGIKMARHTILEHVEEMFGEESAIDAKGKLTKKAVELLEIRFEGAEIGLTPGMDVDEVPSVITVRSMARGVMDVLASVPDKCPACGKSNWTAEDGAHIKCSSCGEQAVFINGDDLIRAWLEKVQEEKKLF
jgi:acyl carrier protein